MRIAGYVFYRVVNISMMNEAVKTIPQLVLTAKIQLLHATIEIIFACKMLSRLCADSQISRTVSYVRAIAQVQVVERTSQGASFIVYGWPAESTSAPRRSAAPAATGQGDGVAHANYSPGARR